MAACHCAVGPCINRWQKNVFQNQAKCKQNVIRPGKQV